MLGRTIAAQALGHAGLRELASEHGGPRPRAVSGEFSAVADTSVRLVHLATDERTERATQP